MKNRKKSENGFSLIEVLIVVLVIAVIATFAITQSGTSRNQFQRQNIAREFKVYMERCRFDSVRRRASEYDDMARIVINSPTSYDVILDSNQSGAIDSFETRTINFASSSGIKILAPTTNYPVTIRFDRRGFLASDNAGNRISPLFTVCNGVCNSNSTVTAENSNVISISPTGTVSMLFGGDIIPPLDDPINSRTNPTDGINRWATVMPQAPTTQTPVVIPGSTPTTTAPPRTCSLNERPSQTACSCQSPMTVHSNGKCS